MAEVDCSDRQDEIIKKLLAEPLKIKKQKDPLMPKRPKSSFLYFCDAHRGIIRKKNSKLTMGDTMRELGKMWRECKDTSKYVKLATDAKEEYEEKMEEYNNNNYYEN